MKSFMSIKMPSWICLGGKCGVTERVYIMQWFSYAGPVFL